MNRYDVQAIPLVTLATLVALGGCRGSNPPDSHSQPGPTAVTAVLAEVRELQPDYRYPGSTAAVSRVDLRARVEGVLVTQAFDAGRDVVAGELLFELDRAPYVAAADAAQAGVAHAMATLSEAERVLQWNRQVDMGRPVAEREALLSSALKARAALEQAEAQFELARIALENTRVRAPLDGRIGPAEVAVGNVVGPDGPPLATLRQLDPIHVDFAVDASELLTARQKRERQGGTRPDVTVRLELANGTEYALEGEIDFVDDHVDATTGKVSARATFPNPQRLLLPGQDVTIQIVIDETKKRLVIPEAAVQQDRTGHYVYVVDGNDKVQKRRVSIGAQVATWREVDSGLATGERVVYGGIQSVAPGVVVSATIKRPKPGRRI